MILPPLTLSCYQLLLTDTKEAENIAFSKAKVRVTAGEIFTRIETILEEPFGMLTTILLLPGTTTISMQHEFHLTRSSFLSNKELLMRFRTELDNRDTFFTDLNGFQVRLPFIKLRKITIIHCVITFSDDQEKEVLQTAGPGECLSRPNFNVHTGRNVTIQYHQWTTTGWIQS